jgi:hypothetical protein
MGLAIFVNMADSPRFATIETIDVVRLIASGMCFGAALYGFATFFADRRSD